MKNYKRGFIAPILILFIVVLAIGGGTYYYLQKNSVSISPEIAAKISGCNATIVDNSLPPIYQQRQKDACIGKIAEDTDDLSLCGEITPSDSEIRDGCYEHFAVERKDMSLCDKISHTSNSYKTYSGIFSQCRSSVAVAKQDLSLCDTLPDERGNFGKDNCYALIGGEKHDYAICNMIPKDSPKDYQNRCIEDVARRKGECDVIPEQIGKDYCYLYQSESVRVYARDNRCDVYKEPKLADLCVKHLSGEITLNAMCNKIVDTALKQQCLTYNINSVHVNYDTNAATVK